MDLLGLILILPLAILAGWVIFSMFRWLHRPAFGQPWPRRFYIVGAIGTLIGVGFDLLVRYHVAKIRIDGFPIPTAIAHTGADEQWVNSAMPAVIRTCGIVTNFLCGVALSMAPLAVAAFFKENQSQSDARGNPQVKQPVK